MSVPLWTAKEMLIYLRVTYNKTEIVDILKKFINILEHRTRQSDDFIYYMKTLFNDLNN